MGSKQDTLRRLGRSQEQRAVEVFRAHYELALKDMTPEHAAATAYDAVQRHLASSCARAMEEPET